MPPAHRRRCLACGGKPQQTPRRLRWSAPFATAGGVHRGRGFCTVLAKTQPMFEEVPKPARRFEPWREGTAERRWRLALRETPWWQLPAAPLVVVAPHPDDEILGAGGSIALAAADGQPVIIISVTDGEKAPVAIAELAAVRRAELEHALATLGVTAEIHRLGVPDGRVRAHEATLADAIAAHIPPGATLLAPQIGDGHPDHDATGRACARVAANHNLTLGAYPIWAWHHRQPHELDVQRLVRVALPAAVRTRKRAALQCFRSQLAPPSDRPVVPPHVLTYFDRPYETFARRLPS